MAVDTGSGTTWLPEDPTPARQPAAADSIVRFVSPPDKVGDRKRLKRERLSPPAALARWLDMGSDQERELFWLNMKKYVSPSSLPNILLEHLHRTKYPVIVSSMAFSTCNYSDISGDPFTGGSVLLRSSCGYPWNERHDHD
jgi:hypothetical protein